jgi:solute:Na+ symporter, SSS family
MNLSPLDLSIVLAYIVLSIFLGFWISQKASKNLRAYFLGDNNMKWYWLGFSNGSGMFDINGAAWRVAMLMIYGIQSVWIPWIWPVWNQVFVMIFLATWIRRSGVMTGAEWIGFRFGQGRGAQWSHMIVVVFAVLAVVSNIAYFFEGIGPFAARLLPWDLSFRLGAFSLSSEHTYALLICFLTTLYTIKGGLYSVVATEVMQYFLMVASCVLIAVFTVQTVDFGEISQLLPAGWFRFWPERQISINWQSTLPFADTQMLRDGFKAFSALVMMMVGKGVLASMAGPTPGFDMQRILSSQTPKDASKMAAFTLLVLFVPLYLMVGGLTILAFKYVMPVLQAQEAPNFEQVLSIVVSQHLPVGLKGLMIAGLLAAFMSTFSAFVNVAPAYLVNDLYKKYFHRGQSERHYVRWSYATSIGIVLIGLVSGLFVSSLNSITVWITSALYGGYAAANVLKWVWWRFNGWGYFSGMLSGMLAAVLVPDALKNLIHRSFPAYNAIADSATLPLYAFFIILLFSFLGSILGCLLTPPTEEAVALNFYRKTKPWGWWKPLEKAALAADPSFEPNRDFWRDALNVLVGMAWQMSMVVMPLFAIFRRWPDLGWSVAVFVLCSLWLKYFWYNRLSQQAG